MKKAGNELLQFLGGFAMLVVGLFILSQKVMVHSSFFGMGLQMGGFYMSNGIIMIPFIIGIIWMFASGGRFASKVFTGLGVLLIIVTIILSTNISLIRLTLFDWVVILVLIFGGAGLLAKVLLAAPKNFPEENKKDREILDMHHKVYEIEKEIERIKKEK